MYRYASPESISQLCLILGRRKAVEVLEMVTLNLKSADTHNVSSSFVRELERNQKKKKKKKKKNSRLLCSL